VSSVTLVEYIKTILDIIISPAKFEIIDSHIILTNNPNGKINFSLLTHDEKIILYSLLDHFKSAEYTIEQKLTKTESNRIPNLKDFEYDKLLDEKFPRNLLAARFASNLLYSINNESHILDTYKTILATFEDYKLSHIEKHLHTFDMAIAVLTENSSMAAVFLKKWNPTLTLLPPISLKTNSPLFMTNQL